MDSCPGTSSNAVRDTEAQAANSDEQAKSQILTTSLPDISEYEWLPVGTSGYQPAEQYQQRCNTWWENRWNARAEQMKLQEQAERERQQQAGHQVPNTDTEPSTPGL